VARSIPKSMFSSTRDFSNQNRIVMSNNVVPNKQTLLTIPSSNRYVFCRGLPHNRRGWFGEKFDSRHTSRSTFLPYAATVISPVSKTQERRGEALVECCRPRAPADYSSWRCTDRGRSFWFRQPPRHPIPGQCTSLEPKFCIVLGGSVGTHACTFASRQVFLSGRR